MQDTLIIVHSTAGDLTHASFDKAHWLRWDTCIRQLAIGFGCETPSGYSTFSGAEAYQFFLEVVSGLHSPIIGETEVMGQFRELLETTSLSTLNDKPQFLSFFKNILTDAKQVRSLTLKDLGSRSYGSYLRKYLKGKNEIGILGAGKIVEEILPWLESSEKVTVKCRNPRQGQKLKEKFDFIQVEEFYSVFSGDTLIVAAPVTSKSIELALHKTVRQVIDLRENSSRDSLKLEIPVLTLAQLFKEIENTEKNLDQKVAKARALIKELSYSWTCKAENRPFGWEDLCG